MDARGRMMSNASTNRKIKIGAYNFPNRKKPCLCIEEGNRIVVYGYFNSSEDAEEFMKKFSELVGIKIDKGE